MPVNTKSAAYRALEAKWRRVRDCYDGEDAIKAAKQLYLPALDSHAENPPQYEAYLKRAAFFNALRRTVDGLAGALNQKAPTFGGLEDAFVSDATLSAVTAEAVVAWAVRESVKIGYCGILADWSAPAGRACWTQYLAEDVINWETAVVNGRRVLTCVVLRESESVPNPKDAFASETRDAYRVLRLDDVGCGVSVWTKQSNNGRDDYASGPVSYPARRGKALDFVPFVFVGAGNPAPCKDDRPPLDDLACVNVSHYRTSADLEQGRHFVALPTPYVIGAADDGKKRYLGPSAAWILPNADCKIGMLEFTGAGLAALVKADEDKRRQMAVLGARLLEDAPPTAETATAFLGRHGGENASLRSIAQAVERDLTDAAKIVVWWEGGAAIPSGADAHVEINKDVFQMRLTPDELRALLQQWQAGGISYETYYERLQSGGWGRDGVTAEDERNAIDNEEPPIDTTGDAGAAEGGVGGPMPGTMPMPGMGTPAPGMPLQVPDVPAEGR
jgi:hypothetical protein